MEIRPIGSEEEWEAVKHIRTRVFIEEQACPPEEEWDEHEATSRHFLGRVDGRPAAAARWRTTPCDRRLAAKLERFAVLPEYRGRGYGRRLVEHLIRDARQAGFDTFVLHAQAHLEPFYASFGFERVSDVFMEAGIPHVEMVRRDDT